MAFCHGTVSFETIFLKKRKSCLAVSEQCVESFLHCAADLTQKICLIVLLPKRAMDQVFFEGQPTVYFKGSRVCLFPKIENPQDEQRHLLVWRAGRGRNNFAEGLPVL